MFGRTVAPVMASAVMMFAAADLLAAVTDLPVTTVGGRKCYYYDVQPKESIYQVAQKLGVSRDDILQGNPSAADGLKPRMRLFFDVDDFADMAPGTRQAIYVAAAGVTRHTVLKGETLYGIARKYGMSPDVLARMNPQAADGLRTGDILLISEGTEGTGGTPADTSPVHAAVPQAVESLAGGEGNAIYEIKPGETLFSIASRSGIALEDILEANPDLDPLGYSAGDRIRLPLDAASASRTPEHPAPLPLVADASGAAPAVPGEPGETLPPVAFATPASSAGTDADHAGEQAAAAEIYDEEPLKVAVLLPFMLNDEAPSRTAQLFTEFYKGMLMAADSLRTDAGHPVELMFFDTAGDADTLRSVLASGQMQEAALVVAPDNPSHLAMVMASVPEETVVLNIFAVKDDSYKEHRNLIQTNIPHDDMYRLAIDRFMTKYEGRTPVFIRRTGGMADKDAFTSGLKERLIAEGRDFREISFNTSLSDGDLAGINPDDTPVVFVPNSGSKNEFAKFVGALTFMRQSAADPSSVTIFGYPEWVTFRGSSFDEICGLDATIYSRYLAIDSDPGVRRLKDRYRKWFGTEMFDAVPAQGILGYDVASYAVNGLRQMQSTGTFPSDYDGVQSYMKLDWSGATGVDAEGQTSSGGGLVNEALYFINFTPDGTVEWQK
ncbi:MAG: LysM peptidoglycan-binding domain-containing protein [Muribaculaceae bacterium]|nr:LysM peptidoglycan-binding domain-containing protein [Muribaculaceae bacterium]